MSSQHDDLSQYTNDEIRDLLLGAKNALKVIAKSVAHLSAADIPAPRLLHIEHLRSIIALYEEEQALRAPARADEIKFSCGKVLAGEAQGTAYLVSPVRAITCAHVAGMSSDVELRFGHLERGQRTASVRKATQGDVAVLSWREPVDLPSLTLAENFINDEHWTSWGYPAVGHDEPIRFEGTVWDAVTRDSTGQPAICLFSQQAAAGLATPARGVSGSPALVRGRVIGHLSRVLSDPDHAGRAAFGLIYAVPSATVRAALSEE